MNSPAPMTKESGQVRLMREKLAQKLAEYLLTSDQSQDLMSELESHQVYSSLRPDMDQEESQSALLSLLENQPNLFPLPLEVLKLPEDEQGEYLYSNLLSNLSNAGQ